MNAPYGLPEDVWSKSIALQRADGYATIPFALALIVGAAWIAMLLWRRSSDARVDVDRWTIRSVVGLVAALLIALGVHGVFEGVYQIVVPEFYAAKELRPGVVGRK